jgi:hypothetical protein
MDRTILVAQDVQGIRDAALDLFERSLSAPGLERALANAAQAGNLQELERIMPESKLSPGYLSFVSYLLWLEGMMGVGAQFKLYADEAEGLRALQMARDEFEREHPRCAACGAAQFTKFAKSCGSCGQKFR